MDDRSPISGRDMPTLLVAEDDPDIRMLLVFRLQHAGHQVLEAANGADALELIRTARPDAAILDVSMPGLSGLEVCRELRASTDGDLRRIPILVLSAYASQREIQAGLEAGADQYLTKPFTASQLAEAVRDVLDRARPALAAAGAATAAARASARAGAMLAGAAGLGGAATALPLSAEAG
jgi:DNA-binding response OmpR family regulator